MEDEFRLPRKTPPQLSHEEIIKKTELVKRLVKKANDNITQLCDSGMTVLVHGKVKMLHITHIDVDIFKM